MHRPQLTMQLPRRSNLAELCQTTSMEFGGDPPLFSKPPGWTPDLMTAHEPPPRPSYSPPPMQPQAEDFQENPLNPSPSRCVVPSCRTIRIDHTLDACVS